jgi:hypothetical protein
MPKKTAKRLCRSKATRCLQNIFIVVLSNHYATSLGRDCNNNFLSMAISAAICPHCIQLSAQRMVIREDRKAPGVLRHAPWLGGKAHALSCNPICEPLL